jgi:hypothetical protein
MKGSWLDYLYIACGLASLVAFIGFVIDLWMRGADSWQINFVVGSFVTLTGAFWLWFYFSPKNAVRTAIEDRRFSIKSYTDGEKQVDVVEGTVEIGLTVGATSVLLPPFVAPPAITLARPDGRSHDGPVPHVVSTNDRFTIKINDSGSSGLWIWRARGVLLRPSH